MEGNGRESLPLSSIDTCFLVAIEKGSNRMMLARRSALLITALTCLVVSSGCSNKSAEDQGATPQPVTSNVQIPPSVPADQQAAVQARIQAGQAEGQAYAKMMDEKFKKK